MISELVMVATITGGFSVVGQVFIARNSNKVREAIIDEKMKVQTQALISLEEKVTKHNSFMQRLALSEQFMGQIKTTLDELQKEHKECMANGFHKR